MVLMFTILLAMGGRIYRAVPPLPVMVTTPTQVLFHSADIHTGRDIWRSLGGMQLGSVWGHGAYLAPDWTADFLHREALAILNARAGGNFAA